MTAPIFFTEYQVRRDSKVVFDSPTPSEWTILEKLSEDNNQIPEADVAHFGYSESYACAKFRCRKDQDQGQEGFMRMYMQVPVQGTEFHPADARAKQAVARRDFQELTVLCHFLEHESTITPRLRAWKEEVQGDDGLVPGGYLTCLVWERVPGVSLAQDRILPADISESNLFWKLPLAERDRIREKFKEEYPYVYRPFLD